SLFKEFKEVVVLKRYLKLVEKFRVFLLKGLLLVTGHLILDVSDHIPNMRLRIRECTIPCLPGKAPPRPSISVYELITLDFDFLHKVRDCHDGLEAHKQMCVIRHTMDRK